MNTCRRKPETHQDRPLHCLLISVLLALQVILFSSAFAQYEFVSQFGENGEGVGQFRTLAEISVDSEGNLLIADKDNNRVQICSYTGECAVLGGFTPPLLQNAYGVAEDQRGRIVVTESSTQSYQVQICERDVVSFCDITFGGPGSMVGQFSSPRGLVIDSQDRIIVVDRLNSRIQICNSEGSCSAFGSNGNAVGEFAGHSGVAVDSDDNIIVADEYDIPSIDQQGSVPIQRVATDNIVLCEALSGE